MRFTHHRENLKPRPAYLAGLLSAAAIAALPMAAQAREDDAAAVVSPALSDNISESAGPDWQQISNNSEIDSSDGPVLELPQVATAGEAEARTTVDSADDEDVSPPFERIGDADEYEDQETVTSALPLWPAQASAVGLPRVYLGANYGAMPRPSVMVVRPAGLIPIPATSPMRAAPRGSRTILGGWWQRAR